MPKKYKQRDIEEYNKALADYKRARKSYLQRIRRAAKRGDLPEEIEPIKPLPKEKRTIKELKREAKRLDTARIKMSTKLKKPKKPPKQKTAKKPKQQKTPKEKKKQKPPIERIPRDTRTKLPTEDDLILDNLKAYIEILTDDTRYGELNKAAMLGMLDDEIKNDKDILLKRIKEYGSDIFDVIKRAYYTYSIDDNIYHYNNNLIWGGDGIPMFEVFSKVIRGRGIGINDAIRYHIFVDFSKRNKLRQLLKKIK